MKLFVSIKPSGTLLTIISLLTLSRIQGRLAFLMRYPQHRVRHRVPLCPFGQ